jgi:DNA segregation ATPase FtsK/SpoIIIE, S-DNA-T family
MPWTLEIRDEEELLEKHVLGDGVFSVGREACDINIQDLKASKQHCNFYVQGEDISVIDSNSTNGTFVNGIRIEKKDLRHNDVVIVGTTRIRILKC